MTVIEFDLKYREIEDPLFGFAMKLTRNRDRANDLMQETFTKGYTHLTSFNDGTNFKAWLSTIMRNSFINDYRKQKTRDKYEMPSESCGGLQELYFTAENASSTLMMEDLQDIVAKIPDTYRIPFLLFYDGWQYHEISEQLDKPIGTIKSRIFTARKMLKGAVQKLYEETSVSVADYMD